MKFIVKTRILILALLVPVFNCLADTPPPVPSTNRLPPPPPPREVPIDQWIWLVFAMAIFFAFIYYRKNTITK